jgi:hypothetical protein
MAIGSPSGKRQISLRLLHNGVQPGIPLDEPLRFGLQDSKGEVHAGTTPPGGAGAQEFDFSVEIREGAAGQPVFRGSFVHGPPAARFIYLSWKREGDHEHPWGWRIKIPLSRIGWSDIRAAEKPGNYLVANVIGRRPHSSEEVTWQIEPLQKS